MRTPAPAPCTLDLVISLVIGVGWASLESNSILRKKLSEKI